MTFLSEKVKEILCSATLDCKDHQGNFVNDDFSLNWNSVDSILKSSLHSEFSDQYYKEIIKKLSPLFNESEFRLNSFIFNCKSDINDYCYWTGQVGIIEKLIGLNLHKANNVNYLISILSLTSMLERGIRNILRCKKANLAFLLRDLLQDNDLLYQIGSTRVSFLKVLVSSVKGLNLRNIAWHGFLSPLEASRKLVAVLLFIIADIGRISNLKVDFGKDINVNEDKIFSTFSSVNTNMLGKDAIETPLISQPMKTAWIELNELVLVRNPLAIVLVFPLLENSLRILYCTVNDLPHKLLTAEDDTFYITFDEMLAKSVEGKDASLEDCDNGVPFVLGQELMVALCDMLQYPSGPRLRDHLSHGEIKICEVSADVILHCHALALIVVHITSWRLRESSAYNNSMYSSSFVTCMMEKLKPLHTSNYSPNMLLSHLKSYVSFYHPYVLLLYDVIKTVTLFTKCKDCGTLETFHSCNDSSLDIIKKNISSLAWPKEFKHSAYNTYILYNFKNLELFLSDIYKEQTGILFCNQSATESYNLMHKIILQMYHSLVMFKDTYDERKLLFSNKKMRSRQRINYHKQVMLTSTIEYNVLFTCQFIFFVFKNVKYFPTKYIKGVKKILKYQENIYSQIKLNKWEEVLKSIKDNLDVVQKLNQF